jgi:hypothetical protein
MTEVVVWLIAFAVILWLSMSRWERSLSPGLDKLMPRVLEPRGENRLVWSLSLAVLGATTLVRPVDILLIAIIIGLVVLVARKLGCWAMNKVQH